MYFASVLTPIGLLGIIFDSFLSVKRIFITDSNKNITIPEFALNFVKQLNLYFKGELLEFSYSVNIQDISEFDKKVLELTSEIPYGETVTYNWLAKKLNTSPRAIGQSLKRNPLPIIIPCHRVIKSDGKLGGYSLGIERKRWLIEHEKSILYRFQLMKLHHRVL